MSLKKYEAFVRTVELGSLTKAAQSLGSTQSRISHILNDLEEDYGFRLMHRTRRKFGTPTRAPCGWGSLPAWRYTGCRA